MKQKGRGCERRVGGGERVYLVSRDPRLDFLLRRKFGEGVLLLTPRPTHHSPFNKTVVPQRVHFESDMRSSARSLARQLAVGGRLAARTAVPSATAVCGSGKGKEKATTTTTTRTDASATRLAYRAGSSIWTSRSRYISAGPSSLLPAVAFLHTTSPTHNVSPGSSTTRTSPLSPSPSPLPPPPSQNPTLAGLGTTQLSPDILLRCTIFDSTGSATSSSGIFKKSHLCSEHGLEPRDLRKIDSRVPNLVPTILARRGGILVNILHIRAMVKRDKVLLFDSYGSTDSQLHSAFVYNLQHNLKSGVGGLAYEFRALESILVSVLDALRIELGVVRGWTSRVLEELDDDVDREKLRTLLQVSRKLTAFLSRGKAVKNAVTEVLENDDDMELMYLSHPPTPPGSGGMDELELLLESFDKQVEEVVAETTQLASDISNTQEIVELILDNNRNKLLALDLKTSIATMGISAGTMWAGLFGMNLKSHMEELDWAFAGISGVAVAAVVVTAGVGLRRLERLRRVGLGMKGSREGRRGVLGGWKGKRVGEGGSMTGYQQQPWTGGYPGINPIHTPSSEHHPPAWWQHPGHPHATHSPAPFAGPSQDTQSSAARTQPEAGTENPVRGGTLGMGLGSKWDNTSGVGGRARLRKGKPPS